MSDYFIVKPKDKHIVFIRTDSGRWYDISGCKVLSDGTVDDNDGLVPHAKRVSDEFVAELVAKYYKPKSKRKASKIREFRKEFV